MDDPDTVESEGRVAVHWLVWNIPPETSTIPEGWTPTTAVEGANEFHNLGYAGPRRHDEGHTYRFKLFALDTTLDVPAGATVAEFGQALNGHVLAQAQLTGTYSP